MKSVKEEILDRLYKLRSGLKKPDLSKMEKFCKYFGSPEKAFEVIHLAGTNGKGSTAAFLEGGLLEKGYKVGRYTSPHLINFNERIKVDGKDIADEKIVSIYREIERAEKTLGVEGNFFEITTLMGFIYFRDMGVDVGIIETGLGGRYDATNVVEAKYSLITNIGYDHMGVLGTTLKEIAREKAGIIKGSEGVILGSRCSILKDEVSRNTSTFRYPSDIVEEYKGTLNKEEFKTEVEVDGKKITLNLFGHHQVENFILAYALLKDMGIELEVIKRGCEKVSWPGRFEVVSRKPITILDGAHNETAMERLVESLKALYKKDEIVFIFTAFKEKKPKKLIGILKKMSNKIIMTSLEGYSGGLSEVEVDDIVKEYNIEYLKDPRKAYDLGKSLNKSAVVVCGSLYLIGKFKGEILGDGKEDS